MKEIVVGKPVSDEDGPDLTFILIPQGGKLSTISAHKSFWNIERDKNDRLVEASNNYGVWVTMGFPNELESQEPISNHVMLAHTNLIGFFGLAKSESRFESNGFDFVDTEAYYNGRDAFPNSFGGVSGGGLWKVDLKKDSDNKWDFEPPIFVE